MGIALDQLGPLAPLAAPQSQARLLWVGAPIEGFDPAGFGLAVRAGEGGSLVAAPDRLPFRDAVFDRVIVNEALVDGGERMQLRELWRVLAPAGLIGLIVPAARPVDFRPHRWRLSELELLLGDSMFEMAAHDTSGSPGRRHLVRAAKSDGLRPALVGRVATALAVKPA